MTIITTRPGPPDEAKAMVPPVRAQPVGSIPGDVVSALQRVEVESSARALLQHLLEGLPGGASGVVILGVLSFHRSFMSYHIDGPVTALLLAALLPRAGHDKEAGGRP